MREIEPPFDLELEGRTITVTEHELKNKRLFYIDFKGWKKSLVITVALTKGKKSFGLPYQKADNKKPKILASSLQTI